MSAQFDYVPYGTCGETDIQEIGRNSQQAGGVPYATDGGFVGSVHTWKSEISLMGVVENRAESLETSACVAEDSEEVGVLENNNHKHDDTTPSENLTAEKHQPLAVEINGELKQEDFAVPASSTGLLETVIIVSSQDPDDEIHDKLGPEPENLGSSHKSPAKSPCRGANIGGSELAEEWKEGSFMVIDEAGEPPAPAATIGGHEEPVELMEEEQSRDHEEVAKPMEDEPDAKRRRINPPVLGEGESLGSVSEDLHL